MSVVGPPCPLYVRLVSATLTKLISFRVRHMYDESDLYEFRLDPNLLSVCTESVLGVEWDVYGNASTLVSSASFTVLRFIVI